MAISVWNGPCVNEARHRVTDGSSMGSGGQLGPLDPPLTVSP